MLQRARLVVVLSGLLPVIACGSPTPDGQVNGTLSGTITVTSFVFANAYAPGEYTGTLVFVAATK